MQLCVVETLPMPLGFSGIYIFKLRISPMISKDHKIYNLQYDELPGEFNGCHKALNTRCSEEKINSEVP